VFLDLQPLDSSVGEEESPTVLRSAPTTSRGSSGTRWAASAGCRPD